MADAILFQLQSQRNPRIGAVVRAAMLGTAVAAIGAAAALPYFGVREPVVAYVLYVIAALESVAAFAMPPIIEKQSAAAVYLFYAERLEIETRGQKFSLPYENIAGVEDVSVAKDSENGLVNIRLKTRTPVNIPFFGIGTTVVLPSLAQADSPYARIKEVVEKSRAA